MTTAKCAIRGVSVLALAGLAFAAGEARKELHFKVGKRPTITVNNPYGSVVVKPGSSNEIVVSATLRSDKVEIDQSQSHNRIDIVSHVLPGADPGTAAVDYQVFVPSDANVNVHSESGPIHGEKLRGDVSFESSSGKMEIADCGEGHVRIKTLNGPVTISNVKNAHVDVVSMAGDVTLNSVSGPYVMVNSNTGNIEYAGDFSGEGEYDFTSHTGNIEATAPAYASIDVVARSSQGRVDSDFSLEPRHTPFLAKAGSSFAGTLGKAASSVKLMSFSGKIHLKKRQ